jgi:hypothetical protein
MKKEGREGREGRESETRGEVFFDEIACCTAQHSTSTQIIWAACNTISKIVLLGRSMLC